MTEVSKTDLGAEVTIASMGNQAATIQYYKQLPNDQVVTCVWKNSAGEPQAGEFFPADLTEVT